MKKLLLVASCLLLAAFLSGCTMPPGTENLFPGPGVPEYSGELCIDPTKIGTTPILTNIPKPDENNVPFPNEPGPGWDCQGGECSGPNAADYVMVTPNVKIDPIWPDRPTTRLVKQILPPDYPQYAAIKDRVYRASCNDWCQLGLPYGGTLHCDFIFFLHNDEPLEPRVTRPGVSEPYPRDGAMFDILIRQGAPIPEYIGQPGRRKPLRCDLITPTPGASTFNWFFEGVSKQTLAQDTTAINIPDPADPGKTARFLFNDEFEITKYKIRDEATGRQKWTETTFRGKQYEVFLNLPRYEPVSADYVYLVEKGGLEQVLAQPYPFYPLIFLEFRRAKEVQPSGRTLQLGTFPIEVSKGWWTLFANESKPAIYLYPEEPTKLRIKLNPAGKLTVSDPPYSPQTGWEVLAYPNGNLEIRNSNLEIRNYPYLFYEAELEKVWVEPEGFIVEGKNLIEFFKEILPKLGLNGQETADFIDYWMSRLDENQAYYFIHFLDNNQIEQLEPLEITQYAIRNTQYASPDNISHITYHISPTPIRLRAYFKPLDQPVDVKPQTLPAPPQRQGFTLVEWGGILDE